MQNEEQVDSSFCVLRSAFIVQRSGFGLPPKTTGSTAMESAAETTAMESAAMESAAESTVAANTEASGNSTGSEASGVRTNDRRGEEMMPAVEIAVETMVEKSAPAKHDARAIEAEVGI